MKRFHFGLGLLAVLLALGLFFSHILTGQQEDICRKLQLAQQAALDGDFAAAEGFLASAQSDWESRWHFNAALADHQPMEDIDGLFAQSQVYLRSQDAGELAATCALLGRNVRAMGDAHALNWWNLL